MKLRPDSDYDHNRAAAAAAHGVDLSVNIDTEVENLNVPIAMSGVVAEVLTEALGRNHVELHRAVDQLKKLFAAVGPESIIGKTKEQVKDAMDVYRQKAPYETE